MEGPYRKLLLVLVLTSVTILPLSLCTSIYGESDSNVNPSPVPYLFASDSAEDIADYQTESDDSKEASTTEIPPPDSGILKIRLYTAHTQDTKSDSSPDAVLKSLEVTSTEATTQENVPSTPTTESPNSPPAVVIDFVPTAGVKEMTEGEDESDAIDLGKLMDDMEKNIRDFVSKVFEDFWENLEEDGAESLSKQDKQGNAQASYSESEEHSTEVSSQVAAGKEDKVVMSSPKVSNNAVEKSKSSGGDVKTNVLVKDFKSSLPSVEKDPQGSTKSPGVYQSEDYIDLASLFEEEDDATVVKGSDNDKDDSDEVGNHLDTPGRLWFASDDDYSDWTAPPEEHTESTSAAVTSNGKDAEDSSESDENAIVIARFPIHLQAGYNESFWYKHFSLIIGLSMVTLGVILMLAGHRCYYVKKAVSAKEDIPVLRTEGLCTTTLTPFPTLWKESKHGNNDYTV